MTTVIPDQIKKDWNSRGYSFGVFRDPPGQVWADFVHKTDELVFLAEGEIKIEIENTSGEFDKHQVWGVPPKDTLSGYPHG